MTLHVGTWIWGSKYPGHYVERLRNAVSRNLSDFVFHVWQPLVIDERLTRIKGCFARLRAFDPEWQDAQGIKEGDRIVSLDLDMVVTGKLDGLFDRDESFTILQGVNAVNPNPYNGSVWMLRAGYRPDVWSDFSLEAAGRMPYYAFPDDQAWFHHKMPTAGAWGPQDGVYGFQKPGWPACNKLPSAAKLVAFFGSRDPAMFQHLDWVKRNWR